MEVREMKKSTKNMVKKVTEKVCYQVSEFEKVVYKDGYSIEDGIEVKTDVSDKIYYLIEDTDNDIIGYDIKGQIVFIVSHRFNPTMVEKAADLILNLRVYND